MNPCIPKCPKEMWLKVGLLEWDAVAWDAEYKTGIIAIVSFGNKDYRVT